MSDEIKIAGLEVQNRLAVSVMVQLAGVIFRGDAEAIPGIIYALHKCADTLAAVMVDPDDAIAAACAAAGSMEAGE